MRRRFPATMMLFATLAPTVVAFGSSGAAQAAGPAEAARLAMVFDDRLDEAGPGDERKRHAVALLELREALRDAAVDEQWLPALQRFQPEMLFFSAGFDAHRDDEMAMLGLVEADYAWVTKTLREATAASAKGRIVSTLEGGYDLPALSRSAAAHLENLIAW